MGSNLPIWVRVVRSATETEGGRGSLEKKRDSMTLFHTKLCS